MCSVSCGGSLLLRAAVVGGRLAALGPAQLLLTVARVCLLILRPRSVRCGAFDAERAEELGVVIRGERAGTGLPGAAEHAAAEQARAGRRGGDRAAGREPADRPEQREEQDDEHPGDPG